jgi:hypothetical protein
MPPSSDPRILNCIQAVNKPHAIAYKEEFWLPLQAFQVLDPARRAAQQRQ